MGLSQHLLEPAQSHGAGLAAAAIHHSAQEQYFQPRHAAVRNLGHTTESVPSLSRRTAI